MSDWRERLDELEREEREKLEAKARGRLPWCRAVEKLWWGEQIPLPAAVAAQRRVRRHELLSQVDDVEVLRYIVHLALLDQDAVEEPEAER